jgi:hypothetical protein
VLGEIKSSRPTRSPAAAAPSPWERNFHKFSLVAEAWRTRVGAVAMTKLVNRGGGGRGGRGGGRPGGPAPGVGKKSQPERRATAGGWKEEFREAFKWKGRAGKAVRARTQPTHPAMRPLAKGRELTADEVRKLIAPVLQPVRAKYGGQGFAKPSTFVDIASDDKDDVIRALYDEHVDGFSGKSYKKMGNAQDMMEWRVRLKAKAEREGTAVARGKRLRETEGVDGNEASADASVSCAVAGEKLSRKQKKKAAQMGLSSEAMLALQTSKVRVRVDDGLRNDAIEAYRAMRRAKLGAGRKR